MRRTVFPLVILLLLGGFLTTALADLDIKKARYGNTTNYRDVTRMVEAYVRMNTLSFPVNAISMGGDPNPRVPDFLFVVYEVDGREFTDTIADGQVFTFRGVANVRAVKPLLSLPFLKPAAPRVSPLQVVNQTALMVRVYSVDRYGRWSFERAVPRGQTSAWDAQVGQTWVITDLSDQVLQDYRVKTGDNTVVISPREPAHRPGGFIGGGVRVRFENGGSRPIYLYNLDQWGRWVWMANIAPGSAYLAASRVGEAWVATDSGNRVVRQINVTRDMSRVRLD